MESQHPHSAPPGSACTVHSERPAFATCPRCGARACVVCWHPAFQLCHTCVTKNPEGIGVPIPWEDKSAPWAIRFWGTLSTAFQPVLSAPALAKGDTRNAMKFALLTAVPLAMLSGIIPYTQTLFFGSNFSVTMTPNVPAWERAIDVIRAMLISLGTDAAQFCALTLPYVSLTKAYGDSSRSEASLRLMLYRAWLIPIGNLLLYVLVWAAPRNAADWVTIAAQLVSLLGLFLIISSMRTTARIVCNVGPVASITVVVVPVILLIIVALLIGQVITPLIPQQPRSPDAAQISGDGMRL